MINSLKLDPFTRALWGEFDAYAIAQLEALLNDRCYTPRLYVAPDLASNLLENAPPGILANGYAEYGLTITPGSIIIGAYLFGTATTSFMLQITDMSLDHAIYDQPVPAWFLQNAKGDFPTLWDTPHPVVGEGLFRMEFWNQLSTPQIIQITLAVLEPCDPQ